jgi:hypothetical protein
MISPEEEAYIADRAYVPEHIVGLMALVSKGEPFLIQGHLCFAKDDWVILVGYPLDGDFTSENFEKVLGDAVKRFRPESLWFIASEVPPSLAQYCRERESDHYYTLELQEFAVRKQLRRLVEKASRTLTVERGRAVSNTHQELIAEFLEREAPGPRIETLFLRMADYVARSSSAVVLSAVDREGRLTAFYVVELAAKGFATYVVGCHSKARYALGASDLLFLEMTNLARESGKAYIHLGLGVNEGIRRFKEKWGGVPFLRYEFCEYVRGRAVLPASFTSKL